MKIIIVILVTCATGIGQESIAKQQIICDGKKIDVDPGTTIINDSKSKFRRSTILNGYAPIILVKPTYPEEARKKRVSGQSSVVVLIDERGKIVSAEAVSGPEMFRPLAVKAVRASTFKKMLTDCKPRKYSGVITYNFSPDR